MEWAVETSSKSEDNFLCGRKLCPFFFLGYRRLEESYMCICRSFSFDISLCIRETVKLNKIGCFVVCLCEGLFSFVFKEIRTVFIL